jgi:hypothetical protein
VIDSRGRADAAAYADNGGSPLRHRDRTRGEGLAGRSACRRNARLRTPPLPVTTTGPSRSNRERGLPHLVDCPRRTPCRPRIRRGRSRHRAGTSRLRPPNGPRPRPGVPRAPGRPDNGRHRPHRRRRQPPPPSRFSALWPRHSTPRWTCPSTPTRPASRSSRTRPDPPGRPGSTATNSTWPRTRPAASNSPDRMTTDRPPAPAGLRINPSGETR